MVTRPGGGIGHGALERPPRAHPGRRGHPGPQQTFYTALYHSLLDPNVVSDDNGQYTGTDGGCTASTVRCPVRELLRVGHLPLRDRARVLLAPGPAGDMIQSLVNDAARRAAGCRSGRSSTVTPSQMNGDSADPIIAAAYAFGVRGFDGEPR